MILMGWPANTRHRLVHTPRRLASQRNPTCQKCLAGKSRGIARQYASCKQLLCNSSLAASGVLIPATDTNARRYQPTKSLPRAGRRDLVALLYHKKPTLLELFVVPQHINYHMRAAALTASPLTTRKPSPLGNRPRMVCEQHDQMSLTQYIVARTEGNRNC